MVEQSWFEPPRRYVDIVEAIEKLREQVWYNRHQVWNEKLESGEAILIGDNEERGKDPIGLRIHRGVWEGAEKSARRVEAKYGLEELGRWTDFEWGMISGKLSALRWVLGTRPTRTVLFDAWYSAKRVTSSLALRSSGDAC